MNIMQNLQFLARQGIPLRGHIDVESNFIQLMKLRSNDQQASITTAVLRSYNNMPYRILLNGWIKRLRSIRVLKYKMNC